MAERDKLVQFAERTPEASAPAALPWKILIADDEEGVHQVTRLALSRHRFFGRPLEYLDAYSGREAVELMRRHHDVAIVLMDVVMETEQAGLDAVDVIRRELKNPFVRIILRTGQPGQAPEHDVVTRYDINDYKEKTELTAKKLFTMVHTALAHYRELIALAANKAGLERIIEASAKVFEKPSLVQFAGGVLEQFAALLFADRDAVIVRVNGVATSRRQGRPPTVLAATGRYAGSEGRDADEVLGPQVLERLYESLQARKTIYHKRELTAYFATDTGVEYVLYLGSDLPMSMFDQQLLDLFCRNIGIAFENLTLHREVVETQRDLVLMLMEAIEWRSRETRNHVRRVGEYSRLLGALSGLPGKDLEVLPLAAAMHDVGKISIPEEILTKPGPLTAQERAIMDKHAENGQQMLQAHEGVILSAAAIVAGQHHENWDGTGYPKRLQGEQIHRFGRITKLADVFDALCSERCYKEAWPDDQVIEYVKQQRGRQFEPALVDLLLVHLDSFLEIKRQYADESTA